MKEAPSRKLAVILHADVVGSTALVQANETLAHERIRDTFQRFSEAISVQGGTAHEVRGDALVAEFSSASDAVEAALDFQSANKASINELPDDIKPILRIGIAMGEVVIADDTVTGEAVVLAQRLEQLAEPGDVCIQGTAQDTVPTRLPYVYENLDKRELKGFSKPIQAFVVRRSVDTPETRVAETSVSKPATLELREKPSIAVLPFTNMSGDPEQEYFVDGITEDIITELSRFQSFVVIARNSTFTYKGKAAKSQEIGRDLGAPYIVEGSVRKSGDRVRVTVQLIEAETGNHIWAEKYDRELVDIFDIQDELTQSIVAKLPRRIEDANVVRVKRSPPNSQGVYDRVLHAKALHHRGSQEDNEKARQLLNEAIDIDSEFAPAWAWKTCVVNQGVVRGYIEWSDELESEMFEWVQNGYEIDENDLESVRIMCEYFMEQADWDKAHRFHEKAYQLTPNDPRILAQRGELLTWLGRPDEAVDWIEKAMKLDPYYADDWAHLMGQAMYGARRYEEAIQAFLGVHALRYNHHAYMAACYAFLGFSEKAKKEAQETLQMKTDFSAKNFALPTRWGVEVPQPRYVKAEDQAHLLEGLRKAGLPE